MPDLTTKEALLERIATATENLKTNVPAKFDNYLQLSGGTMTGVIKSSVETTLARSSNDADILIAGGTSYANGAYISLSGKDRQSDAGIFVLHAGNGSNNVKFVGKPDGTLTWGGQPIQTSSDKRLKQDFSDVPADVLKAWGKVEWKQFKFIADAESKGADNCRWHTGLVAQDVKDVGEKNKVDLCKYGILCHDVREATEDSEAVDMWTIRYEEALAMEIIYLRNEIKKLQSEIRKLKKA